MTVRPIIQIPDPVLRQVSKPVERIDADLLRLLDDMAETMYEAPGIGLAGIQVGVPLRVIALDVEWRSRRRKADEEYGGVDAEEPGEELPDIPKRPVFLINPRILKLAEEASIYEEGCLSIPEYYAEVERPAGCTVAYTDRDGKEIIVEATGLLSTCLQHEIDHLDGRLFIDHISRLKREMVVKRFTKAARQDQRKNGRMVG
jgi:peptide deformylase